MRRFSIALAGLALILCTAAAYADDIVAVTPWPGVTMGVPAGWKACDEATDKLLGSADDPLAIKNVLCPLVAANAEIKFGVLNPKVGFTASVLFLFLEQSPLTPEALDALDDKMLGAVRDEVQKDWEARITKAGGKLDSIAVRRDKISGFSALVSTIVQTPASGAMGQSVTETWEIPAGGHLYQFNLTWSKLLESNAKPAIDAMKPTIKIEPPPPAAK